MASLTEDSSGGPLHRRRDDLALKVMAALAAYYLVVTACSIYAQMYYFGDAAHFFMKMLETADFMRLNPNRQYAHYATQFLPVEGMNVFGIKNYAVLSYLYGINLYLPLLAGLGICYAIVRNTNPYLMVFPLLSFFGVSMNSVFFIVSQAHVISSLFWALLFYVTLRERFSIRDAVVFLAAALIFMKSYESAVFLGPILAFISFSRILRKGGTQKALWAAATLIFVASFIIALREILHPFDATNKSNFIKAILGLYFHYPAVLSMGFILIISSLFLLPELPKRYFAALQILLLGASLVVSFSPLLRPQLIRPYLQYDARVLMAYVIPPMGILFYFIAGGRIPVSGDKWKRAGILTAILIFGQVSWELIAVSQWDGLRKIYKEELSQHRGLLLFEDSIISRAGVGNQLIRALVWPTWTMPTMCILWSDGGNVSTIIVKPEYSGWQPFDPMRVEQLPKVEHLGFSYKTYRESPHEANRIYAPNTRLIFSSAGNYSRYIMDGWSHAEAGHVWSGGKASSLAFKMPEPLHDPVIEADVIPFTAPPRLMKQRVTLIVNGEKIGERDVSKAGTMQFTVPREVWLKNDTAVLEFVLPDAATPRSLGVNEDTRVIALAFRSLTIR